MCQSDIISARASSPNLLGLAFATWVSAVLTTRAKMRGINSTMASSATPVRAWGLLGVGRRPARALNEDGGLALSSLLSALSRHARFHRMRKGDEYRGYEKQAIDIKRGGHINLRGIH